MIVFHLFHTDIFSACSINLVHGQTVCTRIYFPPPHPKRKIESWERVLVVYESEEHSRACVEIDC